MRKRTLTRTLMAACAAVTVSAVVSGCSDSTEDALRADISDLEKKLEAARTAVEAARAEAAMATADAAAARAEAEQAEADADAAEARAASAEADRDAALEAADAARQRAVEAAAAQAGAETQRDMAIARAAAAEAALEELLGGGPDGGGSIVWGPRLGTSNLSAILGAEDEFGPGAAGAVMAAARAAPAAAVNGVSQMSLPDQAVDAMRVAVVHDDEGNLVYELTDDTVMVVRVPSPLPRQGFDLALFTDLIPGIEPDLSSYPHEVLGMWAWDGGVGAFWGRSPEIPGVRPTGISPTGTATYKGDAVGLHAADGSATKFLADVEMVADFDGRTVGGAVDGFRDFAGKSLGALSVTLDETGFSQPGGSPGEAASVDMEGGTGVAGMEGGGTWGARWSDGEGWTMGGTFGFAAGDASMAVLGAFTACSCASIDGGNPDDPVSSSR